MLLHPAIISLFISSLFISAMLAYAAYYGVLILRKWDITSGSELQLMLERRTYLISTILSYVLGFELLSLFLFIHTADSLHRLFVGAMCAAGTLNVNNYGYPVLALKTANFILAGLWLVLNYSDNKGYDYPLLKKKYIFLLAITPLILTEAGMQAAYFLNLKPDVITSCCGTLFSAGSSNITSEIVSLPSIPMKIAFYSGVAITSVSGIYFYLRGKGGYFFSILSLTLFLISVASLISFISLYYYELPTHHCPFCILQNEYGYVGYPLYITMLGGAVSGTGSGILMPFRKIESLRHAVPQIQKKLALAAIVFYLLFTALVTYEILTSALVLEGY